MTTTDPAVPTVTTNDLRGVVRFLYVVYALPLVTAVAYFINFVRTGHYLSLAAALGWCALAWIVTTPLDKARHDYRALKASEAHREVAS